MASVTRGHTWRAGLICIVLIAVLGRVAIIDATANVAPWGDPADYQRNAVSIAGGYGYPSTTIASPGTPSAYRPPAYPFLLGGTYAVFGDHLVVGRILGAVLGVLAVVLLAYLGRELWDERIGLIAGALGAVFLPMAALNATVLSESLFLPVELGLLLTVAKCRRSGCSLRWAVLAGSLCAVAALTRSVADAWILPLLLVIGTARAPGRMRWRAAVGALVAFVLVLTPWTIRNEQVLHAFVPVSTEDGYTFAGQYNTEAGTDDQLLAVWRVPLQVRTLRAVLLPLYLRRGGVDEAELDGTLRHAGLSYLEDNPSHIPVATVLDTLRMLDLGRAHTFTTTVSYRELSLPRALWEPTTLSAQVIALIALAGLLASLTRRLPLALRPWWLWAFPLLMLLLTVPIVGNTRHRVPFDPFLILISALTLAALGDRLRAGRAAGGHGPSTAHGVGAVAAE